MEVAADEQPVVPSAIRGEHGPPVVWRTLTRRDQRTDHGEKDN